MTKRNKCVFAAALVVAVLGVLCALSLVSGARDASGASEGQRTADKGQRVEDIGQWTGGQIAASSTNQMPTVRGTLPYVLTSAAPFDKTLRVAAESLGARTVAPVSRHAILIEANGAVRTRLAADKRFEKIEEIVPSSKIQPELAALIAGGAKSVDVSLIALAPEDRQLVISCVEAGGGEMLKGCINEGDVIRAKLPADLVASLANRGDVQWMEKFEYPTVMNDVAVTNVAMNVQTVWEVHNLTGAGQVLSTSDSGIDTGDMETLHEDLRDRVLDIQVVEGAVKKDVIGHGTHTAGSIAGNGTKSDGRIRGTAHEAHLYVWFCGDGGRGVLEPSTMSALYTNDGAWTNYIHSASWGTALGGQYDSACAQHDRYVWEHPEYLPVFSAGNSGLSGSMTIGSPAAAKNVLAVGATQNLRSKGAGTFDNGDPTITSEYSSRGPCRDGRTKPDVASPGSGVLSTRAYGVDYSYGIYDDYYAYSSGTSMACPLTAGSVALVRQWLVERKGFADEDGKRPTSALMKAVIMGGAKDAPVPNNDQGWGRVDLAETLFPTNGRAVKLVDRIPFAPGFFTNIVVETTNAAPLDVQLVWVDYPGSAVAGQSVPKLVNDLDLTVEARTEGEQTLFYGNGGDAPDTLNNIESVRVANAAPNKYVICVDCKSILHDHTEGGAAALYIRGAFDPDEEVEEPAYVRLKGQGRNFMSLERALEAVKTDGETVEILDWVNLGRPVTLTNSCTIVATNEDAAVSYITRSPGAALTIADGAKVMLSNLVFTASTETPVIVEEGGCLRLNEKVDLGIDYDHIAVSTAAKDGFDLAGALTRPTVIHCDGAMREGDVFGTYSCDMSVAMACANWLICADDPDHELRGGVISDGTMIWKRTSDYPVDESAGYFVDEAGKTNAYYRMERALAQFRDAYTGGRASEFVVRRDGPFDAPFNVDKPLAICGEEGVRPELTVAVTSRFDVVENGSLALSNIVFVGSAPVNEVSEMIFIKVNGGELTLEDGAEICGFTGRVAGKSGVIDLLNGTATMKNGAVIRDCAARGTNGRGGAIYVSCNKDCTLNLEGGTISNCWAATWGGGVYAYLSATAAYSPFVNVSGELTIAGNRSANSAKDDLYLGSAKTMAQFKVVGEVDGKVGIAYPGFGSGNAEGDAFIANGLSDGVSERTLYSFFNDTLDGMIAAEGTGKEAGMLVWAKDPRDPRQCEESEAAAKLIAEGVTFWREVSDALNEATNNCVVEVMSHGGAVSLTNRVVINGRNITLRSEPGASLANQLMRERDAQIVIPSGSELIVTNLDISGYRPSAPITNSVTLFDVNGGKLVLRDAGVLDVTGNGCRDANAITVHNGGMLRMTDFAQIDSCYNLSEDPTGVKETDEGVGGGILIDNATAYFDDAHVRGCRAWQGGGVFACNGSTVYVSGKVNIANNCLPYDKKHACNLDVSDDSALVLTDELTGTIGVTPLSYSIECAGNTNLIATVAYAWSVTSLTNSAAGFERDSDGDVGVAVTNGASALIVWSAALNDGRYTDPRNGTVYVLAGEMPAPSVKASPEPPVIPETPEITLLNVKPVNGGLAITVLATEGGTPVAVAPEQVTGRFEATTDLGDWTTKKVGLTVESSVQNDDGTTTFTVKPAGNPNTAFIRLAQ